MTKTAILGGLAIGQKCARGYSQNTRWEKFLGNTPLSGRVLRVFTTYRGVFNFVMPPTLIPTPTFHPQPQTKSLSLWCLSIEGSSLWCLSLGDFSLESLSLWGFSLWCNLLSQSHVTKWQVRSYHLLNLRSYANPCDQWSQISGSGIYWIYFIMNYVTFNTRSSDNRIMLVPIIQGSDMNSLAYPLKMENWRNSQK